MPSFVALLKISGKVEGAAQRLQKLPQRWLECTTEKVIFGTGGYDAVVFFIAPDIVEANQYIDKYLRRLRPADHDRHCDRREHQASLAHIPPTPFSSPHCFEQNFDLG